MTQVITPKSDQLNADDLIGGPKTITITEVQIKGGQEQPVSIYFKGSDKAFRPCKSMCRVLVTVWGPDANQYVHKSLTLYRDPAVKWGGMEVGGIRISHMSDMAGGALTLALTATKGSRKPFVVKPLVRQEKAAPVDSERALKTLEAAAMNGMKALESAWKALVPQARQMLAGELPRLKKRATECEQAPADEEPTQAPQQEAVSDDSSPFSE